MKKYKRIRWESDLDITPEIFIETDNYHIEQQSITARLNSFRLYGVLSGTVFQIVYKINNDVVFIDELYCTAVTKSGYIIDIQNNIVNQEINLAELDIGTYYAVVRGNPFQPNSEYHIEIQETPQNEGSAISILKIYYNTDSKCWEIAKDFTPPHISLSTSNELIQQYNDIKNELSIAIQELPIEEIALFQLQLLEKELLNYTMQESPAELALLLKKTTALFKLYLEKTKKMNETLLSLIESFIQTPYVHDDIFPILQSGVSCLEEINRKLGAKPEVKETLDII
jgi:hypothetical protein